MKSSKNYFFPFDEYHTPENTKRYFGDRLMLGTRWFFTAKMIQHFFLNRKRVFKGIYDTKLWAQSSYEILKMMEGCGGRFHISGLANLSDEKPVVYIGNHMSTLETMVLPCLVAPVHDVTFVVKEALVHDKVFGPIMRSREPIVVGRTDSRADFNTVMTQGTEKLSKGRSIIIFPQSRRTTEFIPKEFNTLGVKLAKQANVQVVPFALKTDFWKNGKLMSHLGAIDRKLPIYFKFGEAMDITGQGKEEQQKIIHFIEENLAEWNKE